MRTPATRQGVLTLLFVLTLVLAGCPSTSRHGADVVAHADAADALPLGGLYGPAVREVVVEVDYQRGAEPYTGASLAVGDTWDLFVRNAQALFAAAPRALVVPTRLDGMEALSDVPAGDYSVEAILAIAARHRAERDSPERRTFYVVFLDGYFLQDGAPQHEVLGVSIGATGVIAMFKPVIRASAPGDGTALHRFVEQATLVHEFGHAAGLVHNGLALTSVHQDPEHGAHCSNPDCVMYWLNEGARDMVDYVSRRVASGREVLFDDACLDDARAASGRSQ